MNGIIVYSELEETALGLLTKGRELASELNKPLSVVLLGDQAGDQAENTFAYGATQAFIADAPALTNFQAPDRLHSARSRTCSAFSPETISRLCYGRDQPLY